MTFAIRIAFVCLAALGASPAREPPGDIHPVALSASPPASRDEPLGVMDVGIGRLSLSDELTLELLALVPSDRRIVLKSLGDADDQAVATELQRILEANGRDVIRVMAKSPVQPPAHKIALSGGEFEYILTVAPSAGRAPS